MKILFVIKSLATSAGGAERILTRISTALAERGHDVTLLTFDAKGSQDFYAVGPDVGRSFLGAGDTQKRSGPIVTTIRMARIRKAARTLRPDVAVGFMHSAYVPLALALVGTGIPVLGSERTSYEHYRRKPMQRGLVRAVLPLIHAMTVNGEAIRERFPATWAKKMFVVPNPIEAVRAQADPVGAADKLLLSVGGLRKEKDHSTLVAAFARIALRHPDWRLLLVGDGACRTALEDQVRVLGLGSRVSFVGAVKDVGREYSRAQLFVLPSLYEAFPNCLAESLAHGLPAIGFADCPGTNQLIVPGLNGALAEGSDRVESLARVLDELMASPRRRASLGKAARASVKGNALPAITDLWENLLVSMKEGRATTASSLKVRPPISISPRSPA